MISVKALVSYLILCLILVASCTQTSEYAKLKEEFKLNMPEEEVKKLMTMPTADFEKEVEAAIKQDCERDTASMAQKQISKLDFLRRMTNMITIKKTALKPKQIDSLIHAVKLDYTLRKVGICW